MPVRCALTVKATLGILALAAWGAALDAQSYFGQNQVEYRRFEWHVIETEHFLVHYYPPERIAAYDAARLAERDYARLSRLLDHQFRERKPILLFASRADFGQNNVTGDLGEGVGGVTEALRDRIIVPFTGDLHSFEHVLAHEMTHEFQYDVFGRGRAGAGLQTLALVNPPLWFMEGMAEYLSLGPNHALTSAVMRDAVLNGHLPTVEQMTREPHRYFPYRYGEALWAYIGERWGDDVIGEIMADVPGMGVERAFRVVLGLSFADLSEDWRLAMEARYLPGVAALNRARTFATPLLTPRRTGGTIFVAPTLSSDGRYIAFISTGRFLRGEVFPDLWLADARTGKRIERLVRSTTNPDFTELNLLYSQNDFSPDGRYLAFTALTGGQDVLYLLDLPHHTVVHRYHLPVDVSSPAFSPDGSSIVFTGTWGGVSHLYIIDVSGKRLRRLTDDRHGDRQPQWSPNGRTIVFASDRGADANFALLRLPRWHICLYDIESGRVTVLPGQDGLNLNPMWAPDGQSIAYISDRTGTANIFLYDIETQHHYQLTRVVGAVSAFTEYSPAITWARRADRLAFTYYEGDEYHVWSVDNPRVLRRAPIVDTAAVTPAIFADRSADSALGISTLSSRAPGGTTRADSEAAAAARSFYRDPAGEIRRSDTLGAVAQTAAAAPLTVVGVLDSAALALPDSAQFRDHPYHVAFHADYVAEPVIGYGANNYYSGVYGGTAVILSDLVGDQHLALSAQVNGRLADAQVFAAYANLARRLQYTIGAYQAPDYYYSSDQYTVGSGTAGSEALQLTRDAVRQAFAVSLYPLNRFVRWELGARYTNLARSTYFISRQINLTTGSSPGYNLDSVRTASTDNFVLPFLALVADDALFGTSGPISGHRMRFQVEPALGSKTWVEYAADYRRYVPIVFDNLTLATRLLGDVKMGPNELFVPEYIASPYLLRGYDRADGYYRGCDITNSASAGCSVVQALGSRILLGNAELRFPVVRRVDLGVLPVALPPIDGILFSDIGVAWSGDQTLYWSRPAHYNVAKQRYPLASYGAGVRVNLYNIAILRWDFAVPIDAGWRGYWRWSVGPDF